MSDIIEAFEKWASSYPKMDGGISLAKAKEVSHFTYVYLLPEFGLDAWQAALAQAGAVVPEWIKCSERMPTQADSDYNSDVWYYDEITGEVELAFVLHAHGYTHWRPTGLKPPAKPQQEQES